MLPLIMHEGGCDVDVVDGGRGVAVRIKRKVQGGEKVSI